MKKGLTLLFTLFTLVIFTACNSLIPYNSVNQSTEPNKTTEFIYETDRSYKIGDIEFDCSSVLTFEDEENGGTFRYNDPYISLSVDALHSVIGKKLSSLYTIPKGAETFERKDYYIQGCPAYKDSYAIINENANNYLSTLAVDCNGYTYTFLCLTDYDHKNICTEIINSVESSLVISEPEMTENKEAPTTIYSEPSTEKPSQNELGSANYPIPLGETATINPDKHTELELSISNVITGDKAWELIQTYNIYNKEPPKGYKYVMFDVNVHCVSTDLEDGFEINKVSFCSANDSKSILTGTSNGRLVLDNVLDAVLFTGSSAEGTVAIEMPIDQTGYIIFKHYKKYYFFNLS